LFTRSPSLKFIQDHNIQKSFQAPGICGAQKPDLEKRNFAATTAWQLKPWTPMVSIEQLLSSGAEADSRPFLGRSLNPCDTF
jgi:hypothetical protein